jgi:hypothetical protein
MNIKINESKLYGILEKLVDNALVSIRTESEDWGLGEMDELDEIDSIDKITIINIVNTDKVYVYINIYRNTNRYDFDNVVGELEYKINRWFPNIKIKLNDVIDERKFGHGIDW